MHRSAVLVKGSQLLPNEWYKHSCFSSYGANVGKYVYSAMQEFVFTFWSYDTAETGFF